MDLSIFLAKLFGLYFLIIGGIVMARQKSLMPVITEMLGSRALVVLVALGELAAGLAIIIAHPVWTSDWQGLITLIGVVMVAESVFYLTIPYTKAVRYVKKFNNPTWYTSGGMLAVVMGAYLAGKGFGMW
jgi:hypothetical protein